MCLSTDTWHPHGDVEMISCVMKWGINVSAAVKADVHTHDFMENRNDDEILNKSH